MGLGVAGAAKNAQVQSGILLSDFARLPAPLTGRPAGGKSVRPQARPGPKSRAYHASSHLLLHNQPLAIDHRGPQPLLSSTRLPDTTMDATTVHNPTAPSPALIPHVPILPLDDRFITSLTSPLLQVLFGMVRNRSPAAQAMCCLVDLPTASKPFVSLMPGGLAQTRHVGIVEFLSPGPSFLLRK